MQTCFRVLHTFALPLPGLLPPGEQRVQTGAVLCSQLSGCLAGSSLTLITFSSSTLQLADVAAHFCHILNLDSVFLARVQLRSVSSSHSFVWR